MAYGYILACDRSQFIGLHDCDILTCRRELLASTLLPGYESQSSLQALQGLLQPGGRSSARPSHPPLCQPFDPGPGEYPGIIALLGLPGRLPLPFGWGILHTRQLSSDQPPPWRLGIGSRGVGGGLSQLIP